MGSWTQTLSRTITAPGTVPTVTTRNLTYDGEGRLAKTAVTRQATPGNLSTTTTHFLISSATGNVIAEYNGSGTKTMASVYGTGRSLPGS